MSYRNFWKGWTGGDRIDRASLHSNLGIKLSRVFPYSPQGGRRKQKSQKTDYYFWNLADFSSELSFICERRQMDIGCVQGTGEDYQGEASRTRHGDKCLPWDSPDTEGWFDDEQLQR